VAKLCLKVWQEAGLIMPDSRTAFLMARCNTAILILASAR
jgi:hypothetical protein